MSPRPRTVADADILAAAAKVMSRLGPGNSGWRRWPSEVGLSPCHPRAALRLEARPAASARRRRRRRVGRRLLRSRPSGAPFAARGLLAAATEMTRHIKSAEEMANHLAFLQIDLSDPDFYRLMLENSNKILAGYQALLEEAVAAGELTPCDTARLARAVGALAGGSLIAWAVFREGTAERWVRDDFATLLGPYRRPAKPATRRHNRRRSRARVARRT